MPIADFLRACGLTLQPYQRPLIDALSRGETIRPMNFDALRRAQRATLHAHRELFQRYAAALR
jgi:hypothetical protein